MAWCTHLLKNGHSLCCEIIYFRFCFHLRQQAAVDQTILGCCFSFAFRRQVIQGNLFHLQVIASRNALP